MKSILDQTEELLVATNLSSEEKTLLIKYVSKLREPDKLRIMRMIKMDGKLIKSFVTLVKELDQDKSRFAEQFEALVMESVKSEL